MRLLCWRSRFSIYPAFIEINQQPWTFLLDFLICKDSLHWLITIRSYFPFNGYLNVIWGHLSTSNLLWDICIKITIFLIKIFTFLYDIFLLYHLLLLLLMNLDLLLIHTSWNQIRLLIIHRIYTILSSCGWSTYFLRTSFNSFFGLLYTAVIIDLFIWIRNLLLLLL